MVKLVLVVRNGGITKLLVRKPVVQMIRPDAIVRTLYFLTFVGGKT